MLERIRNWLIRKLGGVPRDTYENVVEIANRHQHGLLKLQQEQRRIIPVFARVDTYRLQGRPEATPDYIERELVRLISEQLFSSNLVSLENEERAIKARIDVVDRRRPYGGHNS